MTREVQLIDAATHTFMWRLHVQAARLRAEHAHNLARCRRDLPRYSEPQLLANLARVIGQQLQHFEEGMPVESAEWSSARALCIELDTGKTWQKWQQQMEMKRPFPPLCSPQRSSLWIESESVWHRS